MENSSIDITLGKWNHFVVFSSEIRDLRNDSSHLKNLDGLENCIVSIGAEKRKYLCCTWATTVLAKRSHSNIAKQNFTLVQEIVVVNIFVQMLS